MKFARVTRGLGVLLSATALVTLVALCFASVSGEKPTNSSKSNQPGKTVKLHLPDATVSAWVTAIKDARAAISASSLPEERKKVMDTSWSKIEQDFPIIWDWMLQDSGTNVQAWLDPEKSDGIETQAIERALSELDSKSAFHSDYSNQKTWTSQQRLTFYVRVCEVRRALRLQPLLSKYPKIVFTKHYNFGGSHYAYTEGQSDAQGERTFVAGSALCVLTMNGIYGSVETLLQDPNGVIRDPDVSYDANRLLFSWKKSLKEDDFHLYEMDLKSHKVRPITAGLGFADYEGIYLPNDDLLFNSTRCVQTVDCWITEVSNFYTCDKDGKYLRRLGFDQVHTNFPSMLEDGRVVYTRWDYNDRSQMFPQPLFQMNPDGTSQTEFYGNNSYFPTTLMHARGIPGTQKVLAVFSGHHNRQAGKLGIVDPAAGRQENQGARLIAPVRNTPAVRIDSYGQESELFQYPYPLSEHQFIVTYHPTGWKPGLDQNKDPKFKIYYMDSDGRRELLTADKDLSCNQPVPLAVRNRPHVRPSLVDYSKNTGTYYIQDIYAGPGLRGIARGAIKSIRVVALEFRVSPIGLMFCVGPGGAGHSSSPPSMSGGAWDVKKIIGTADVYEDGSAMFQVPARTPVYFQALDAKGHAVQSMRSWSTLQPGENLSCVGCHESKNSAPMGGKVTMAMKAGVQKLADFYGPPRGFSFGKEIQPILDKNCVSCHNDRTQRINKAQRDWAHVVVCPSFVAKESEWQYTTNAPDAGWQNTEFDSTKWAKGTAGFSNGVEVIGKRTEWKSSDIWMRREFTVESEDKIGKPELLMSFHGNAEVFINGIPALTSAGNYSGFQSLAASQAALASIHSGKNILAVRAGCKDGIGFIDLALVNAAKQGRAFSLTKDIVIDPNEGRPMRKWSDSYVALTQAEFTGESTFTGKPNALVSWIYAQSIPGMLPPYYAGAAKSRLITMLANGHKGVKLAKENLDKLACWIDLCVPYCGDYRESANWSEDQMRIYNSFLDKRARMEAIERKNIESLLQSQRSSKSKSRPMTH